MAVGGARSSTIRSSERGREVSSHVRRRTMTQSDAVHAAAVARRLMSPVLVTGVEIARDITIIAPTEFDELGIDEQYQRVRNVREVNDLITVIRSGGQIPDPVDISERPDGSRWIVDGQQRFWAHRETKTEMAAHIHKVDSIAAEVRLFVALNSKTRLTAKAVVKGWPGATGALIRQLNTSDKSPLRGMIDMSNNSKLPLESTTVVKGILAVTTGIMPNGDFTTKVLPRTDTALGTPGAVAWAEAFTQLLAAVFGNQRRVRVLPVVALGLVAHRKYTASGRPVFPSSTTRLRATNWDTLVPTHAVQYLPLLEQRIERLWR